MDLEPVGNDTSRFGSFVEHLTRVIGHADRTKPLRDYCTGLLAAQGRKSVEPLAAVTAPGEVSAQHQKLLHFVAKRIISIAGSSASRPIVRWW
jgi:SRSO17 transposase